MSTDVGEKQGLALPQGMQDVINQIAVEMAVWGQGKVTGQLIFEVNVANGGTGLEKLQIISKRRVK